MLQNEEYVKNEEYAYPAYKFDLVSTSLISLKIDENCNRAFLKCSGQVYLVPPRSTGKGYGRTSVVVSGLKGLNVR